MGWRENMGILKSKPYLQKVQNIQKPPGQPPFVPIIPFVDRESKIKADPTPSPDLSKIYPEDRREYTDLWHKAWTLADFIDGGEQAGPYADRAAKLPELKRMVERMRTIENMLKAVKKPKIAPIN